MTQKVTIQELLETTGHLATTLECMKPGRGTVIFVALGSTTSALAAELSNAGWVVVHTQFEVVL